MKIFYIAAILIFSTSISFAQWTKISSIPTTDIIALTSNNNIMYAATRGNTVYKSSDGGIDWVPITPIPTPANIADLIFYNNILYVGTTRFGVFRSADGGSTWQNNGLVPQEISDFGFGIKNNVLYAATLGNGVAVMNAVTNNWSFINNELPNYSFNVNKVIGSPNFLLAAAGANGTIYRFNFNNNSWNEEYYDGILHPGLKIDNLINTGDTVFAVNFNRIITSTNAGATWTNDILGTHTGIYRTIYEGSNKLFTATYVTPTPTTPDGTWIQQRDKNAAIGTNWTPGEEFLANGITYSLIEFNDKLFLAKSDGLFFKNLEPIILPVSFTLFNANCKGDKVVLNWATVQEQNSSRFDIERSADGSQWAVIGNRTTTGNSPTEKNYSFTDNSPMQNNYYRIAEYDSDGKVQYSGITRSSCNVSDKFSLWPNPAHDNLYINIFSANKSQASIRIFDGKGALVKMQMKTVLQGSNQFTIDTGLLPNGVYQLFAEWNNGKSKMTKELLKQ